MSSSTYNPQDLKALLDRYSVEYNVPEFIDSDPVRFPRRFSDKRDIEIAALLISTISWGKRAMILRDAERLLSILDNSPYHFVTEGDIESIPDDNIHRTFFGRHLRYYLRGLRNIYSGHASLEDFAASIGAISSESPAWTLAEGISAKLHEANNATDMAEASRCLPSRPDTSALKRLNMALRWLVRNDGIVDIGCWSAIAPERLYIPLDVHVGNISRGLGLLQRKQNDRRAVIELTDGLKKLNPKDPVVYDFALFGLGVTGDAESQALI